MDYGRGTGINYAYRQAFELDIERDCVPSMARPRGN